MANLKIQLENNLPPKELRALDREVWAFNAQAAGKDDWRQLVVTARNADWELVGGLRGHTHWDWLFIGQLWVDLPLRGKGIGQQLVTAAEDEAIRRGCHHAHLDTHDFQARGFYEKLGYRVFGTLDDYPPGHRRFFLKKALQP